MKKYSYEAFFPILFLIQQLFCRARTPRPRTLFIRPTKYGRSVVHLTQLYAHPDGLGVYAWTHGRSKPTPWRQTTVVQEENLDGLHRRSDGETVAAR
jgi:hypothetical protein